ncbi:DUF3558 domain-containing protein [Nocardia amamiensis]|uniref:DUF3558 domain-containing protein n=1 Tax=Nocardia amamiensis TaxID=404578 RepID=UPI00340C420C
MRALAVAAGLCAVLAVAGCGTDVSGQSQPSPAASLTSAELYDPCTLPSDAISAAGANPATKDDNPFLTPREGWKGCSWKANGFTLAVFATTHPIAEFRSNSLFHDFKDVDVSGRKAVSYLVGNKTPPDECDVTFETSRGVVQINAGRWIDSKSAVDVCSIAIQSASALSRWIPR